MISHSSGVKSFQGDTSCINAPIKVGNSDSGAANCAGEKSQSSKFMKGMVERLKFYNPTLHETMLRGGGRRTQDQIGPENQGNNSALEGEEATRMNE